MAAAAADFTIQYVTLGETIADIALKQKVSASVTATSSILLAVLVILSFVLNLMLLATIFSSYKLRNTILYLMFCLQAMLNLTDVIMVMFFSLLYVSNGRWSFGDTFCKLNALTQEFLFLKSLLTLMLMAMERAVGLLGKHLVTPKHFTILSIFFTFASMCFAFPTLLPNFYVHAYRFRYLCAIGSNSPIFYTIIHILIYGGSLFVLLVCFGSLLTYRIDTRSLPNKPQDYSSFITESRALQDHLVMGRLVLFMTLAYLLIQGPYICMNFFIQIRNSKEMLLQYDGVDFEIAQEFETMITYLRFFFPLITPLLILGNCPDIWTKFLNLVCCRRNTNHLFGAWGQIGRAKGSFHPNQNNVLTLVATADGLQLRVPTNYNQTVYDNSYQTEQKQQLQQENTPFEPEFDSRSKIVEFERVKEEGQTSKAPDSQLKSKMYGKQENKVVSSNNSTTTASKLKKPRAGRDRNGKEKKRK